MKKYGLFVIYGVMLLLFVFKMFYYREELFYVPDEEAHISYVAYVEENQDKWIPEFEYMRLCEGGIDAGDGTYQYVLQGRTCYLGHPPLYYRLMQLVGGVVTAEQDGQRYVYARLDRLKTANIYLTAVTMVLILYIGFSRLGKKTQSFIWHGLYAAAATSVPMLALCGSGITNDNLANLGVAVFMLGILRYYEEKKGYLTYFLVAAGFFLAIMSKLTVGEFLVLVLAVVFIQDVVKNRNMSLICNRHFLVTLPVYLIAGGYFVMLLVRYGSIQPGLDVVAPEEQTFVAEAERAAMNFRSYIPYFLRQFGYTWKGIYNGRFFDFKLDDIWTGRIFMWILYAPFVCAAVSGIKAGLSLTGRKNNTGSAYGAVYIAVAVGLLLTIATQLVKGYQSFTGRGYMGGYQARYYLCDIPFMALAMAEGMYLLSKLSPMGLIKLLQKKLPGIKALQVLKETSCRRVYEGLVKAFGIVFIGWMLYGDFIYFLCEHRVY